MKVLLLLSQERSNPESIEYCFNKLKDDPKGEIHAVYILDQSFSSKMETYLSEATFVADKPGQEISEALQKEYEKRGDDSLKGICKKFSGAGIKCKTVEKAGEYFDVAKALVKDLDPDLVVTTEKKSSFVSKICGRSDSKKFKEFVRCEMKVFS